MLASKITVLGKSVPVWLASLALLAATAGAAVGIVLAGGVTGEIITTVDQSLLVESTTAYSLPTTATETLRVKPAQFNAVTDDGTKFTAATEIMTGESVAVAVAAKNRSTDTMAVLIKLDLMPGITADVDGSDEARISGNGTRGKITGGVPAAAGKQIGSDTCVRMSLSEWKCKLVTQKVADLVTGNNPDHTHKAGEYDSASGIATTKPKLLIGTGSTHDTVTTTDFQDIQFGDGDYIIRLALNDETPPGFYTTGVTMTQIENKN